MAESKAEARGETELLATIELEHAIGFSGPIHDSLFYHPNGREFVYAAGGCVVICDFSDPHSQVFLRGHDDTISCVAVSPSGCMVATGQTGDNADVIVWDYTSRKPIFRFAEHDYGISCVAFSNDERLLCTIGSVEDKKMFIWDLATGSIVTSLPAPGPSKTTAVAFGGMVRDVKRRDTSSYQMASVGSRQMVLWAVDPMSGEMTGGKTQTGAFVRDYTCLAWSADFETLFAGTTSGDFVCIQVKTNSLLSAVPACAGGVHSLVVPSVLGSGGGGGGGMIDEMRVIVGGGDGSVSVWTGDREREGGRFELSAQSVLSGRVNSLCGSSDSVEALAGTDQGFVYRLRCKDVTSLLVCENHSAAVRCVAYPADQSERFATCSNDNTVRIWDASDYSVTAKAFVRDGAAPTSVVYSLDALISGWEDGRIRCHHVETSELLWEIPDAHRGGVTALVLSNNQRFVVSGGAEGEVRVWELRSRELVSHLKEHTMRVTQLTLFDDDVHALSCSRDRSFLCWDLRREKRVSNHTQRMGGVNAIALSRDQTQVLTVGQEKHITYWDLREPSPVQVVQRAHADEATCIAMSHSGQLFATGGTDQIVKLWDYATGQLLRDGVGHSGRVNSVQFSPDDRQLVSGGDDGNILVWNVYV